MPVSAGAKALFAQVAAVHAYSVQPGLPKVSTVPGSEDRDVRACVRTTPER